MFDIVLIAQTVTSYTFKRRMTLDSVYGLDSSKSLNQVYSVTNVQKSLFCKSYATGSIPD